MSVAPEVFIGTSGYSFPDWVGPFYPRGTPSKEFLPYYAKQFGCVEVNSTYYGIPAPRVLAQMAERTPDGFRFVVKVNQAMTHAGNDDPALHAKFRDAIQPLKDCGKYHGLLAQFPWAFRREEASKARLERLREQFIGEPLWVEFRHASWMHPKLPAWLRERDLGYCAVDEPALPGLLPPVTHVTNGVGYVRFHGRNATHWWGPRGGGATGVASRGDGAAAAGGRSGAAARAPHDGGPGGPAPPPHSKQQLRYDHDYSEAELMQWVGRVNALASQAKQTYLFFNNCHAGQAAKSAKLMEELLRRQQSAL